MIISDSEVQARYQFQPPNNPTVTKQVTVQKSRKTSNQKMIYKSKWNLYPSVLCCVFLFFLTSDFLTFLFNFLIALAVCNLPCGRYFLIKKVYVSHRIQNYKFQMVWKKTLSDVASMNNPSGNSMKLFQIMNEI